LIEAMQPGRSVIRLARISGTALALACVVVPSSAPAHSRTGNGELSPRLADLTRPVVRTASPAERAAALGVAAQGPGSLLERGGRLLVHVRFQGDAAAAADALRAAGGDVREVSAEYLTAAVSVAPANLPAIAAVPGVVSVSEAREPFTSAVQCFGAATSEGDVQLSAMAARTGFEPFELDGSGVKVGILSDSFDRDVGAPTRAAADVASGDLPGAGNPCGRATPVGLLDDSYSFADASDEGRAMAQIVHDLAPGAELEFATAFFPTELGFAENIRALGEAGADVIVDDVFYAEEPFFQEGLVGVAVREVSEDGVAYFSSAGNNNLIEEPTPGVKRNIASWEAPEFRDSGGCPAALAPVPGFETGECMDFDPGPGEPDEGFGLTIDAGATLAVDLQWAEPRYGVKTDLDIVLLDAAGNPIVEEVAGEEVFFVDSTDNNVEGGEGSTEKPVEFLQWENDTGSAETVQLAINRCFGACNPDASEATKPRLKIALLQNGDGVSASEYPEPSGEDVVGPTIFGHNGAADAVSVGAIRYGASGAPEPFSSRGPVTHYFGPVEGTTPAAELNDPLILQKPDLVATDGGANTFFGSCVAHTWRFFGTSAAAPHAAAIAALQLQGEPAATAEEAKDAQRDTADPVGLFGPNAIGAGRVDGQEAVSALLPEPFLPGAQSLQPAPQNCGFPPQPPPGQPQPSAPSTAAASDRTPPRTFFRQRPRRVILAAGRKVRATFRFGSNERNVTFICRLDGGLSRFCRQRFSRRFAIGPHTLRVAARDAAGNVDRTPAVYSFRVKPRGS
jgi:hypothetical protein